MLKKNKNLAVSISISSLIIIFGFISVYFIHNTMSKQTSNEISKLKIVEVSKTNAETTKDLKTIIHDSQKFVVSIEVETSNGTVTGSGFLYDNKGDIITNGLVSYFYNSINSQDYVTAYFLLGSAWQTSTPYDKFRTGYILSLIHI